MPHSCWRLASGGSCIQDSLFTYPFCTKCCKMLKNLAPMRSTSSTLNISSCEDGLQAYCAPNGLGFIYFFKKENIPLQLLWLSVLVLADTIISLPQASTAYFQIPLQNGLFFLKEAFLYYQTMAILTVLRPRRHTTFPNTLSLPFSRLLVFLLLVSERIRYLLHASLNKMPISNPIKQLQKQVNNHIRAFHKNTSVYNGSFVRLDPACS